MENSTNVIFQELRQTMFTVLNWGLVVDLRVNRFNLVRDLNCNSASIIIDIIYFENLLNHYGNLFLDIWQFIDFHSADLKLKQSLQNTKLYQNIYFEVMKRSNAAQKCLYQSIAKTSTKRKIVRKSIESPSIIDKNEKNDGEIDAINTFIDSAINWRQM